MKGNITRIVLTVAGLIVLVALIYAAVANRSSDVATDVDQIEPKTSDTTKSPTPVAKNVGQKQPTVSAIVSTNVITNILQVLTTPTPYIGNKIKLRGRLKVLTIQRALPCDEETGSNCGPYAEINLGMIDPDIGENFFPDKVIPVYKRTSVAGQYEPYRCTLTNPTGIDHIFNCGIYVPGSVIDLIGTVLKAEVPISVMGDSSGGKKIQESKSEYYLLID